MLGEYIFVLEADFIYILRIVSTTKKPYNLVNVKSVIFSIVCKCHYHERRIKIARVTRSVNHTAVEHPAILINYNLVLYRHICMDISSIFCRNFNFDYVVNR